MIDVHSHIIQNVDDGSKSLDSSLKMLVEEKKQGIDKLIFTPHYRRRMFETSAKEIVLSFFQLKELVKESHIDIDLYLGQEIYVRNMESLSRSLNKLDEESVLTFGYTKYVLLEFSYTDEIDISEVVYETVRRGYKPIIAHVERYQYLDLEKVAEIKSAKGLIQVNASSIIGKDGFKAKRFINKLIKNNLVDMVGSDIHETRINYMNKAYNFVSKKHGEEVAKCIFNNNAELIVEEMNNSRSSADEFYNKLINIEG